MSPRTENVLSFALWVGVAALWLFVALFSSGCVPPNLRPSRPGDEYRRSELERERLEEIQRAIGYDHVLHGEYP